MNNHDSKWGALIAGVFRLRWMLRWLIPSALLLGLHWLLGTPWWLALLPPAWCYGRLYMMTAFVKWAGKVSTPSPGAVSLKGSLLKDDSLKKD